MIVKGRSLLNYEIGITIDFDDFYCYRCDYMKVKKMADLVYIIGEFDHKLRMFSSIEQIRGICKDCKTVMMDKFNEYKFLTKSELLRYSKEHEIAKVMNE